MRNSTILKFFLSIFLVVGIGLYGQAQIPKTPTIQMLLTDGSGDPVANGSYSVTVSMYDVLSGGTALWSETQNVNVTDGLANIILGSSTPINLLFDMQYYVGIVIGSGNELSPRLPLNPSTYSLSAMAVFGASNVFPGDGNVGVGTLFPMAKLDIEGNLRIADVPESMEEKPNILVHDSQNSQIVKQMPFDSLLVVISGSGLAGPVGPAGPIGPVGPKGPAGPAGGAGAPGQDLIVKDSMGNEVFRVNAKDGTSYHKGNEFFEGGITVAENDSTGGVEISPKGEIAIYDSTGQWSTIFEPDGTSYHRGHEYYYGGISVGHPDSSTQLHVGKNGEIGIYDAIGFPVWEIDKEGKSKHFGKETYYDGFNVPQDVFLGGGNINFDTKKGMVITDFLGDTVTTFGYDGTSFHKGLETYTGGMVIGDPKGTHTRIGEDGKISVYGYEGKLVTQFNTDGTSLHTGLETYEYGLKVGAPDSTYFKIKNNGEFGILNGNQWVTLFRPDGTSYHSGREQFSGGLIVGKPGGSWTNINDDGKIQVVNSEGQVVTEFNPDGTSWHKGLEKYIGGIEIPLSGGGKVVISPDPEIGLAIFDASGNFLQHLRGDGAAYHASNLSVGGTLSAQNLNVSGEKNFIIDHPLDPDNKSLVHRSIESSDRVNFYNGNVKLSKKGEAIVTLPEWFQELNENFRYQLTAVGAPGPNLYIASKITDNQFKIAGGKKGMEVSWQVTGNRKDKHANGKPAEVEVQKVSKDLSSSSSLNRKNSQSYD